VEWMRKVKPPAEYPPEEGRYVRGNDYSPAAVVVILATFDFATPPEVEALVMSALDAGAALAGTLQTENVGIEKIVCNVVANPNIRYIVICGEESPGHLPGEALKALVENGVDENKRIVGTGAPTPYLYNLPPEVVERFRKQVSVVDLIGCTDPRRVAEAVRCCYQETPTRFDGYVLYDPGAYPEPPIVHKIAWKVSKPWLEAAGTEIPPHALRLLLKVASNKTRRDLLTLLWEVGGASLDELKETLKLPDKDLNYHLSVLESVKLVKRDENFVSVTPEGVALLKFQQRRK